MISQVSFRFADEALNQQLIALLKKERIRHTINAKGQILFSLNDEESVENDLINSIRDKVFPEWQVLSCPKDWPEMYERYMAQHAIPFQERIDRWAHIFPPPSKIPPPPLETRLWSFKDHPIEFTNRTPRKSAAKGRALIARLLAAECQIDMRLEPL